MAIVFVSPKQRQKMFFLGITILFLLFLFVVGTVVFFSKPASVPTEEVFKKPKIKIDFEVLDLEQIKEGSLMGRVQKEFTYLATTDKGKQESGSVFAASIEEAKKKLEDKKLINITLEEVLIGRENPFAPYYTIISSTINKKTDNNKTE
ncbi:MAG: hypothetical protein HY219_01995 [Candidatus Staskawiczbacteria bacterium]|nr:hypothetical protein [Candidatus Staskawiczbacteria bacterium]